MPLDVLSLFWGSPTGCLSCFMGILEGAFELMRYCEICGHAPAEAHHFLHTRGAGGSNEPENILWLCRRHHMEFHARGGHTFMRRYGHRLPREIRERWERERG